MNVAATLIMNDDVDGAEVGLKKGDSSFHKVRDPWLFERTVPAHSHKISP